MRHPILWLASSLSACALAATLAIAPLVDERDARRQVRERVDAGDDAGAEALARRLLLEAERLHGARSPEGVRALTALVDTLSRLHLVPSADDRSLGERAVALAEERFGPDHPDVAFAVEAQARLLDASDDNEEALGLLRRALGIVERGLDPTDPRLAEVLEELGCTLRAMGRFPEAQEQLERAVAILDRPQTEPAVLARTLTNLAWLEFYVGRLEEGLGHAERSQRIRSELYGAESLPVGKNLTLLATIRANLGRNEEAQADFDRSLRILESLRGPDDDTVARVLNGRANLFATLGDYERARADYERAIAIFTAAYGPKHRVVAVGLDNFANLLSDIGDFSGARSRYERALEIRRGTLGAEHPDTAFGLANLAWMHRALGDLDQAQTMMRQALAIFERSYGPEHPIVGQLLTNLGALLEEGGDAAAARPLYERAVRILEAAFGPQHPDLARVLNNQATLLGKLGERDVAQRIFARALAIQTEALGRENSGTANVLGNLSDVQAASGDWAEALASAREAARILERAVGAEHPLAAEIAGKLTRLELVTGDRPGALAGALRLESAALEQFRWTARSLSEREALRYTAILETGRDVALSVLAAGVPGNATAVGAAWDRLVRARAIVLDEMAERHRAALTQATPEAQKLLAQLGRTRNLLAHLMVSEPDELPAEESQRRRAELQAELERTERQLASSSQSFREQLDRSAIGLEQVAQALPAGSALVAFVQYRRIGSLGAARAGVRAPEDVPSYLAFVLRAGGAARAVPLGDVAGIDRLVATWRERVARPPSSPSSASAYAEASRELRRAVWDPLARELEGAARVFVVPDGALHLLNLETLATEDDAFLLETGPELSYLSAERDLGSAETGRAGKGLLVLGGPDFDGRSATSGPTPARADGEVYRGASSSCPEFRSLRFAALASARAEADEVESQWRAAAAAGSAEAEEPVLKLVGRGAGESAFKREARGRRVLHLATHGFWVDERCPSGETPLLLSGLALAGANLRDELPPDGDGEDGILTAEEIASLDLRGVEWVVLSACETGVGPVVTGEGVLGLHRAFRVAGAGTVIMSLWPVGDHLTREWTRRLYAGRLAGRSAAGAVRQAGLEVVQSRRRAGVSPHPFYWGAFVAAGDRR